MANQWVEVEQDALLQVGDHVRLYYHIAGSKTLFQATQVSAIESNIAKNHPEYKVLRHSYPDENNIMWWEIEVTDAAKAMPVYKAGVPVKAIVSVVAAGVVLLGFWYVFQKAEKYVPAVTKALTGDPETGQKGLIPEVTKLVLVSIGGYLGLKWFKGRGSNAKAL